MFKSQEAEKKYKHDWYINNCDKIRIQAHKRYEINKEIIKKRSKEWKSTHREKVNESSRKYMANRRKNDASLPDYVKKWRKDHPEKVHAWEKLYKQTHREKINETSRKWYSKSGKISVIARQDKRNRELGSNLLNNWFEGCNRHHITNNDIICIPKDLHTSVWHNHNKPETMKRINMAAWCYMETSVL